MWSKNLHVIQEPLKIPNADSWVQLQMDDSYQIHHSEHHFLL
jgi:hypothetical protein